MPHLIGRGREARCLAGLISQNSPVRFRGPLIRGGLTMASAKKLGMAATSSILLAAAVVSVAPRDEHPSIADELATVQGTKHEGASPEDLRAKYATAYNKARTWKLTRIHACEACGKTASQLKAIGGHLETHHVISVEEIWTRHLDAGLIGDPDNLIVLCRMTGGGCHFLVGHDPDGPGPAKPNFKKSNPNVRRDAARQLAKTRQAI